MKKNNKLLEEAYEAAKKFDLIRDRIKKLSEASAEFKAKLIGIMDEIQRDTLEFPCDYEEGKNLKVSRYVSTKVVYNEEMLIPILKKKGILKETCRLTVDYKKLEEAVASGILNLKEVVKASSVQPTSVFRVSKTKRKEV